MQLNLKVKMKMKIKLNKSILVLLLVQSIIFSKNYFIYATAESEDEVSLLRFDGNKIHLHKNIKVGVNPVEIEGPHGINISPDDVTRSSTSMILSYKGSDKMICRSKRFGLFWYAIRN